MLKPLAICVEDINAAPTASRYTRCVALPGRQPGLKLDGEGKILWRSDDTAAICACELWVSEDSRLILYRPEGSSPAVLHRAGRSLNVPCDKPVILINMDRLDIGNRQLRIHLHGKTSDVTAPTPLASDAKQHFLKPKFLAQAAALAAMIGALAVSGGCVEVRENPPAPLPPDDPIEEEMEGTVEQQTTDNKLFHKTYDI